MMRGNRSHGSAGLKLSYSQGVPSHLRGGIREITNLYTAADSRGKGDASKLLQDVCNEADHERLVLILMPIPFDKVDALSELNLIEWYAKFGFTIIQDKPTMMARPAHV